MKTLIVVTCALLSGLPALAQSGPVTCKSAVATHTDADAAYIAERFPDAERLFAEQVSTTPTDAAWTGLVHSQIQRNEVAEALATANRAVAALPKSAEARVLVGDAELRAGHLDKAAAAYTEARSLDPCSAGAHFGNGRLLLLSSMRQSALKELALAHRLALTDSEISETVFSLLPPAMHAKGLRNLLASATDLPPAHRQRLEQKAALLEMGATCQPVEFPPVAKVPLTPIFFNGTKVRDYAIRVAQGDAAINLELDSTASGIVLMASDAKKLNVTPASGDQATAPYLGYVSSIQIGSLRYGKCAVAVVPDAALASQYSVIGTSFFQDSLIHLDWVAKEMTLSAYPDAPASAGEPRLIDASVPSSEKAWVRAIVDDGRVLVPAAVEKHPVGLVMLDTSSTLNMLSPLAAANASLKTHLDDTVSVTGVSGPLVRIFRKDGGVNLDRSDVLSPEAKNVPVRVIGDRVTVVFAANEPPDFPLFSFDNSAASHAAGVEINGMIGYAVLRQYFIDFDYRNGLVNLKYDIGFPLRDSALFTY
jgi:hypothetical protein